MYLFLEINLMYNMLNANYCEIIFSSIIYYLFFVIIEFIMLFTMDLNILLCAYMYII